MRIRLLTITHKVPTWIREGYGDYAKRITSPCTLELVEIAAEKRGPNADVKRVTDREGEKMLAAIKPHHRVIALDVKGKLWSTEQLAENLTEWQRDGRPLDLLVGGPDGLAEACVARADIQWSLSTLTFPHILVRIILAEQFYRAVSILNQHPYHRG